MAIYLQEPGPLRLYWYLEQVVTLPLYSVMTSIESLEADLLLFDSKGSFAILFHVCSK